MFYLSDLSENRLAGVHPKLVGLANAAIKITTVDFGVQEGVRSLEHEQQCINQGVSKLHNPADCQHCIQADGFGHAMDLVPYIDGQPKWVWEAIYPVAAALQQVALAQGVRLRWGGVWDRVLNDLSLGPVALKAAVGEYCARHAGPDFLDGPHYELVI